MRCRDTKSSIGANISQITLPATSNPPRLPRPGRKVRAVIALGGHALLRRDGPSDEIQRRHVGAAVEALIPLARDHDLVVTYGSGTQVGLFAHESFPSCPRPFDDLVAQTQGVIGYWLLQGLENELPGQQVVSLVCQTLVDGDDPAFLNATMFVGPVYQGDDARRLAVERGWQVRQDGAPGRRVVASPEPQALIEMSTVCTSLGDGAVVFAGGGGIPVCRSASGHLHGRRRCRRHGFDCSHVGSRPGSRRPPAP